MKRITALYFEGGEGDPPTEPPTNGDPEREGQTQGSGGEPPPPEQQPAGGN